MVWSLIAATGLVPMPWRNGGGTSRTIASLRGVDGAILWEVSIADLVADGGFSDYSGYDRTLTPIEGPPPALAFDGGPFEACPLLVPRRFSGGVRTSCRVTGPGRAFNVIVARGRLAAKVKVVRGASFAVPEAEVVLVHCVAGCLDAGDLRAGMGDSLLGPGATPLAGNAEAIVVAIDAF